LQEGFGEIVNDFIVAPKEFMKPEMQISEIFSLKNMEIKQKL
jgi:hypothetical protein